MDILVDTSTITKDMSGTGVYTRGLLASLLSRKAVDRVTAVGGDLSHFSTNKGDKLHHVFGGRTDWHTLLNRDLAGNRPNLQADLALFPNYFMPPGFSIPSLVTVHDVSFLSHPRFYTRRMRLFYRKRILHSFRRADAILTVSQSSRDTIARYYPDYRSKLKVVRPGYRLAADRSRFTNGSSAGSTRTLIYLGTVEPRKNILSMLEGFQQAELTDTRLFLIGKMNGTYRYVQKVRKKLSSISHAKYLGYLPDETVRSYISRADGVVNVSKLEGFGFSILEALAGGLPCMISEDPALMELADGHAVTVDAHSIESISEGFQKLCNRDHSGVERYAETIRDSLTWDAFGRKMVQHLKQVQKERLPEMKSCNITDHSIQQEILEALAYSAVFEAPIEKKKLYQGLGTKVDYATFSKQLNHLKSRAPSLVEQEGYFYSLQPWARDGKEYVTEKYRNRQFLLKYRDVLRRIDRLPFIQGLYFSGGSVHGSQLEQRDLDLFIVTQSNRIWLVYAMLKVISKFLMHKSVLCFNYLVDSEALRIRYQQDYFTAHQLLYLQPALPDKEYPDLQAHNRWIRTYFPNAPYSELEQEKANATASNSRDNSGSLWNPLNLLNLLLMTCFSFAWRRKGLGNLEGGLMWDAHRIKLHTNDHRPWIYRRFNEIMRDVKDRTGYLFDRSSARFADGEEAPSVKEDETELTG